MGGKQDGNEAYGKAGARGLALESWLGSADRRAEAGSGRRRRENRSQRKGAEPGPRSRQGAPGHRKGLAY